MKTGYWSTTWVSLTHRKINVGLVTLPRLFPVIHDKESNVLLLIYLKLRRVVTSSHVHLMSHVCEYLQWKVFLTPECVYVYSTFFSCFVYSQMSFVDKETTERKNKVETRNAIS